MSQHHQVNLNQMAPLTSSIGQMSAETAVDLSDNSELRGNASLLDVLIVGGGFAGSSAALYTARSLPQ